MVMPSSIRAALGALLAGGVIAVALTGCESSEASGSLRLLPEVAEADGRYRLEYVLTAGDTLDIVVIKHSDVSRSVVIRPDGYISLPLLDDIKASGFTVRELDVRLTALLSSRLREPEVTVVATSVREPQVFVYGEVLTPTVVPLRRASNVAQAVATAGGFNVSADIESVILMRVHDDGRLVASKIELSLSGQPAPYMQAYNVPLRADDMIFVPKTGIAQVNEWVNSFVSKPLQGVNSAVSTYANLKIIESLNDD